MPLTRSLILYDQWQSDIALGGGGGESTEKKKESRRAKGKVVHRKEATNSPVFVQFYFKKKL